MDNYRVTVGVEPTNDYEKAKQDVMQAMISIRKLPLYQQRMLVEKFAGTANVTAMNKYSPANFWTADNCFSVDQ